MSTDPLAQLTAAGVAVWLDDLSRARLRSGSLARMVQEQHVVGVTTNPTIFAKALSEGTAYADQVKDLALRGVAVGEAVRMLTTWDVRAACDVLRPVYERSHGQDGRVSIEVDPRLAHDTERTVAEARGLWWLVDRPNLFVKVPATLAGLPAITAALAEGISVNVTLIFSLERYRAVVDAFLTGLERRAEAGGSLENLESVASFFVSRVDTEVDKRLEGRPEAERLQGRAAVANARLAYEIHEETLASARWRALEAKGARPQRPLWASTGVKNPAYEDTRYVVDLALPGTVNTMPEATLQATADHGRLPQDAPSRAAIYEDSRGIVERLRGLDIDLGEVAVKLEEQGVASFEKSWDELIATVTDQLRRAGADVMPGGAAKPAGGAGPAAASPRATAR